jgi:ribosomal protein S18 acetylase RimI-like enzyme
MLSMRQLSAINSEDIDALFLLFKQASNYFVIIENRKPEYNDAYLTLAELPPLKDIKDKLCIGFFINQQLVGCTELIKHYPTKHIAYLGLMLFSEDFQGQGLGKRALQQVITISKSWNCQMLRLAVIETNQQALSFWKREGFNEIYRKSFPQYTGEAIVMERSIAHAR